MREITLDNIDTIDERRCYGIDNCGTLGVVSRNDYDSGLWRSRCSESFTQGNGWSNGTHVSLHDCIRQLIGGSMISKVFEFDSFKELCAWIANDGRPVTNKHGEELEVL